MSNSNSLNVSNNNLFILTPANAAEYVRRRTEHTKFQIIGSVTEEQARETYSKELTVAVNNLLENPSTVLVEDPDLLAKVMQGHAIWAQELRDLGIKSLPPVAVVVDKNTPNSSCGFFYTDDQVIHLSPNSNSTSAEIIAHEFGHAGGYQLNVFNNKKVLFPITMGMKRANITNGTFVNCLLEELASMSFPLNEKTRKNIPFGVSSYKLTFNLDAIKDNPEKLLKIKLLLAVFEPESYRDMIREFGEDKIGIALEYAAKNGRKEIFFKLPCYNLKSALGGVNSAYNLACYNLDLISKECFSEPNEIKDQIFLRQTLIKGQLDGFPSLFYRLMCSVHGRDSLTFFYSLRGSNPADNSDDHAKMISDQVYFSIFANASRLPDNECLHVRKKIIDLYKSLGQNKYIEDTFDRINPK